MLPVGRSPVRTLHAGEGTAQNRMQSVFVLIKGLFSHYLASDYVCYNSYLMLAYYQNITFSNVSLSHNILLMLA